MARWTMDDDMTCCLMYLEQVKFNNGSSWEYHDLLHNLQLELPHIPKSSLKMKLQNIKQLCIESGLKDGLRISPLENYSVQNKRAFDAIRKHLGI